MSDGRTVTTGKSSIICRVNVRIENGPVSTHSLSMFRRLLSLISALALPGVAVCFLAGGCQKAPVAATPAPPAAQVAPPLPTEAQPKLKTMKIYLGSEEMSVELALTDRQIQTGMMFRTNVDEGTGMLFVFANPYQPGFWMKNCPQPLDGAFIDPTGHILEFMDMKPLDTNSLVAHSDQVQFVLETKHGWFEQHHIPVGTVIRTDKGSLRQAFPALGGGP